MDTTQNLNRLFGEADRITLTTVMDNYTDVFLLGSEITERWGPPDMVTGQPATYGRPAPLLAEHGFSMFVQASNGDQAITLLFDTGFTETGVPYNLDNLGIDVNALDAIVFSHGHPDHTASVSEIMKLAKRRIPVITHPDAFRKRYLIFPDGNRVLSNTLSEQHLVKAGADIRLYREESLLSPFAMVSGEINMENDFEQHFSLAHFETSEGMEKDFFEDEKSLILNLKNKGLIVMSGCGHRGIINTLEYARKITGIDHIHAVIGGFHLTGTTPVEKIKRTVAEMQRIQPDYIIPTHCTGLKAMKFFADAMPENFILNAVGTKFTFTA